MLQNHRPYQLMLSKTGSPLLAGAVAQGARLYGALRLSLQAMRKAGETLPTAEEARAALQAICPKPQPSGEVPPLPPQDEQVDLSVIIPSYNVEKYIDGCMQSILSQECSERLQVIVVDGDSKDKTMECLRAYENDSRVALVQTKGRSSAARGRNEGLLHATGRYLMFVDSDDKLAAGAVKALMDAARKTDADIVQGGWQYIDENDVPGPKQYYVQEQYTGKKALDCFDLPGMPWGKIYRRELFEKIRFPENYTCFEDTAIQFLIFRSTPKIASIAEMAYLWRRNPKGLTSSNQHRPAAVQSYWIMEELLAQDARLHLPHDERFCASFVMQLSNHCYATISKMDEAVQKDIFVLCCDLYARTMRPGMTQGQPYAVRCGAKALEERRFDLWCCQGRMFRLL